MEDVNQGAPSQDTSSVPEGNQATPPQSPAEAQNTGQEEWQPDKNARFVPYDRFQEVVQTRNELKEKFKLYEGKDELLKTYEAFDNVLTQNPELFNAIMYLIQGGNQQNMQQQQQQMDTTQQLAYDNYLGRFNQFCSENNIAQDIAPYVYQVAESFFLKINPDPLRNYNPQALNQALVHTKKFLDSISKSNLASYVQTKNKDNVPTSASTGGSPPTPAPRPLNSQQDRAAAMAEMMRAGGF